MADVVSSATIHLMRNTPDGDVREKSELSRFMDIHPYSLGTRKTFISWIVLTLLTAGDGNAFVLPVTRDGYLEDLVPMPGAFAVGHRRREQLYRQLAGSGVLPGSSAALCLPAQSPAALDGAGASESS